MVGFLEWLAPQIDKLPNLLSETFTGSRARANGAGIHLRVPEALAHLWLGAHTALLYPGDLAALSHEGAEERRAKVWTALLEVGKEQSRNIEGERPARRFLEVVSTLMTQGRAILLPKGQWPDSDLRSDFLGWLDSEYAYFLPEVAFRTVIHF